MPQKRHPLSTRALLVTCFLFGMVAIAICIRGGVTPIATDIELDSRPPFVMDASKPFVIELGRGSGWHGLDLVKVTETGAVELRRIARNTRGATIEAASLKLSPSDVAKVVGLANAHKLTSMARSYSDPRFADGTQWVLWIQQSSLEKSVYCNNSFPVQITAFAESVDAVIQGAGSSRISWSPIPQERGNDEQAALWARVEPAK